MMGVLQFRLFTIHRFFPLWHLWQTFLNEADNLEQLQNACEMLDKGQCAASAFATHWAGIQDAVCQQKRQFSVEKIEKSSQLQQG